MFFPRSFCGGERFAPGRWSPFCEECPSCRVTLLCSQPVTELPNKPPTLAPLPPQKNYIFAPSNPPSHPRRFFLFARQPFCGLAVGRQARLKKGASQLLRGTSLQKGLKNKATKCLINDIVVMSTIHTYGIELIVALEVSPAIK